MKSIIQNKIIQILLVVLVTGLTITGYVFSQERIGDGNSLPSQQLPHVRSPHRLLGINGDMDSYWNSSIVEYKPLDGDGIRYVIEFSNEQDNSTVKYLYTRNIRRLDANISGYNPNTPEQWEVDYEIQKSLNLDGRNAGLIPFKQEAFYGLYEYFVVDVDQETRQGESLYLYDIESDWIGYPETDQDGYYELSSIQVTLRAVDEQQRAGQLTKVTKLIESMKRIELSIEDYKEDSLTSPFGSGTYWVQVNQGYTKTHQAIDLVPNDRYYQESEAFKETGVELIYTLCDGSIAARRDISTGANVIVQTCDSGNVIEYWHQETNLVRSEDTKTQGSVIGIMGSTGISTGPHLHLIVREDGEVVDPGKTLSEL